VTKKYSSSVAKGKVMAEKPKAGTHLPEGSTVDLTVSRGKKPKPKPKHRPH
jgi:beta-lactam-binding protein with PASTA domain